MQVAVGSSAEGQHLKLAVLIDADNVKAAVIERLFMEIAHYGEATVDGG